MLNPRFIRQLLRDKSTRYRLSFCFRVHFESRDLTFTRVKWYDIISLLALFWSLHNRRLTPGLTISQARQTRHCASRETSASHDFWSIYSKTLRICFYPGTVVQSAIINMKLTRFIMAVNLVPSLLELPGPEKSKALGTRLNKSLCGITIDLSLGLPWERPSLKMGSVFPSGTILPLVSFQRVR